MRCHALPCVDDVDGRGSPDRRQIARGYGRPARTGPGCRVHFQVSSPLTSKPSGAIVFSSSWSATEFLNFASTFTLGGAPPSTDSPDRLRIDCGSLLSGIRNRPRRATTLPPLEG